MASPRNADDGGHVNVLRAFVATPPRIIKADAIRYVVKHSPRRDRRRILQGVSLWRVDVYLQCTGVKSSQK